MGNIVEFQANLHPVTRIGFGPGAAKQKTKLSIKIAQINKAAHDQDPTHELKQGSNWVWAIVQRPRDSLIDSSQGVSRRP